MKVLYVAWTDLGNCNWLRAEALRRHTDVEAKCFSLNEANHTDLPRTKEGLKEGVQWADVIHQSDTYPWYFGLDRHPAFIQEFRGGLVRMYSKPLWDWQIARRKAIITTPNNSRYLPRTHYMPLPMDTESMLPDDDWPRIHNPLRVIQTPTRRDYKDTDMLIEACAKVDGAELEIIEGKSKEEALEAKRRSDVYFGQMAFGNFGGSEREAMCYGLIVLNRLQPIVRFYNPGCPILQVNSVDDMASQLRWIIDNPSEALDLEERCHDWVREWFSFKAVAPRQKAFYEYILNGDDEGSKWFNIHSKIWQETAEREHGITEFIDPFTNRW
jgi:glycosyltransferase involved in cell wall biosynthesis